MEPVINNSRAARHSPSETSAAPERPPSAMPPIDRDATRRHLLLMCCCGSGLLAVTVCLRVDGHSCVSAYWDAVTCVLNITGDPSEQSAYSLKFIDTYGNEEISCPLTAMNNTYGCVCKLKDGSNTFSSNDEYNIEVCRDSRCRLLSENFEPSQNIRLTPPLQAVVERSPETYNFTWTSGYEDHRYLAGILDYELFLQTCHSEEGNTLSPNSHERSLSVPRSQLKAEATCCIKVRSTPGHRDYEGTWSDWSPATCWENEAGEGQADRLAILTKSLGPVFAAVGVLLLFVFYSPTARKKIKTLSHTPSPAPFFEPLFQQHDGNLQEWLSPQGKFVLTYKTDEIFTPNAVIVVAKPKTKEPEENRDSHNPSVPQMDFAQCQIAYVGFPGIHEVSLPLTSPGDTSYTEWTCSVLEVDPREVEVASSPPEDFFSITSADSGCGCEDLTQSPECRSPHSPVVDNPLPSYNDYCILNKTAGGYAPVLLSKGSGLNITPNALHEDTS